MKIKFVFLIFTFWFISCKENKNEVMEKTSVLVPKIVEQKIVTPKFENKTAELLYKLEKNKFDAISKISISGENTNVVYENFRKINDELLALLNETEEKLLNEDYVSFYSEVSNEIIVPAKYQSKINDIKKAGLSITSIGEGFHELQQKPDFYYEIFKNVVTDDYRAYLKNEAFDNLKLYSADGGLVIPLEELSQRIINWENFLTKHSKSKLFVKSREQFKEYLMDYLFGMENTPSFEYDTNLVISQNKNEFERFVKNNKNSFSSKVVTLFLDKTNRPIDSNKLYPIIENEQSKYLKPAK